MKALILAAVLGVFALHGHAHAQTAGRSDNCQGGYMALEDGHPVIVCPLVMTREQAEAYNRQVEQTNQAEADQMARDEERQRQENIKSGACNEPDWQRPADCFDAPPAH